MKSHGAGVITEKSMRSEILFFLRFDPRLFPPFSSLPLFFSSPLSCAFLPHGYLGHARSFGLGGITLLLFDGYIILTL